MEKKNINQTYSNKTRKNKRTSKIIEKHDQKSRTNGKRQRNKSIARSKKKHGTNGTSQRTNAQNNGKLLASYRKSQ